MNDALFPPTPAAAAARLAAVNPGAYARTRNALDGAVTRLSPYLTHGFLHVPEVLAALLARGPLAPGHKLVFELAWREFFHHAWRHDGERIFSSLKQGPLPDAAYARSLPADVAEARSGVPAIDAAVRTLYATGYLHNHARMWLASYLVHLRKVHWRVGADWLYGHLLDGDLASNHLSWQWVAGTGSHRPYLFNAENVAKYAPIEWHSPGTAIDTGYGSLAALAATPRAVPGGSMKGAGLAPPALLDAPPAADFGPPDPALIAGQAVWLVHPWSLATPPPGSLVIAICDRDFHGRWPWSARRWAFVSQRMTALTPHRWWASGPALMDALAGAQSVQGVGNLHLGAAFAPLALPPMPRACVDPTRRAGSFSNFWAKALPALSANWTASSPS